MLRVINLSRAQPAARNLSLITKRYQQSSTKSTSGSNTTQSTSSSSSSTSSNPPKSPPTTPPPASKTTSPSSSASYPSTSGGSGGTVKAIVYGVALGLGVTLLYAEYDNGSFRRKVESILPLSSTILSGLDKIIDPVFGRHKKLTTIISEKMPDVSGITDKLPDKEQIQKAGEQAKNVANAAYDKLPSQKQLEKAGEKAKDAINDAYDKLPEYKKVKGAVTHAADQVKGAVTHAADQVKDAAHAVRDALPQTKGVSGEQGRRGNDPVFLEEPGEVVTKPPIKPK